MSLLLEGKRAFITGGTRGIGAALCEIFAREGADVAFNFNSREDLADQVRQKIESFGRRALSFKVSVTDRLCLIFFLLIRLPPRSTLFPFTTIIVRSGST